MRWARIGITVTFALVALGAAPTTERATTVPVSKPGSTSKSGLTTKPSARKAPSDASKAAVRAAVAALSSEYEKYLQHPGEDVRASSNYFRDHPNPDLSAEVILAAMQGVGGDPRVAAYVRWQLLSGLPDELDESAATQLLAAYRAAPPPIPRPGISREDQQKLDVLVQGVKQADEPVLIEKIELALSANRRDNMPILRYRDTLYQRLPNGLESFAAAIEDLQERTETASEGKDLIKAFVADVRNWAATNEPPPTQQQLAALGKAVRRLADTKGPQYYQSPYWRERSNVFAWRKTRSGIDTGHALKDLAVFLDEQSLRPPLNLEIKQGNHR